MSLGLVGQKCGMTRVFNEAGVATSVTIVSVAPNRITQIKTVGTDGYGAIQITTGDKKAHRVSKALKGHFAKAGTGVGRGLWEFPLAADDARLKELTVGAELKVDFFSEGQAIDVTGTSKGKGFAGTIKRHNFAGQDATHGNSLSHRAPGSIGQNQSPGRVFKGKKMAGQMGNVRCTVQNLSVLKVDAERGLLWVKGAVPGANRGLVIVRPAVKAKPEGPSS